MIPYKEYAACKAAEGKASTASKPALEEEENWDEEPSLPPCETPPGAKPMVPSQEDEWKLIINQDPHSGSVAGDSGHEMMAVTEEDKPVSSNEELVGAVGGVDESVTPENISDVECSDIDRRQSCFITQIMRPKIWCSQALGKSSSASGKSIIFDTS